MKERGIIKDISGDEITIEIEPKKECTKCCSCGASHPGKITVDKNTLAGAAEGDSVEIEIKTASMMTVYLMIYGVPLVVFIAALIATYALSDSPGKSFLCAMAATAGAYLLIGKAFKRNPRFIPEVRLKKLRQQPEAEKQVN